MLGLDTNVLVRLLVRDDENQFERARRLVKREIAAGRPPRVSLLALQETVWVLERRYGLAKAALLQTLCGLLEAADLQLEDEPAIEEALHVWKDSAAGFADCLIGAHYRRQGCAATASFDAKALKLPGFVAA